MKICKICSRPMDDNFNACPYCGADVNAQPTEENNQQNTYQQNSNYNSYGDTPPFTGSFQQQTGYQQSSSNYTPEPRPQRSAYIAAILAFFGGFLGLHNFYLDNKKTAWIQLIISLVGIVLTFGIATVAMEVWGVIDGLKLLKGEINLDGTGAKIKMGI